MSILIVLIYLFALLHSCNPIGSVLLFPTIVLCRLKTSSGYPLSTCCAALEEEIIKQNDLPLGKALSSGNIPAPFVVNSVAVNSSDVPAP